MSDTCCTVSLASNGVVVGVPDAADRGVDTRWNSQLGGGQPGNEIQTPLAQAVLGGLLTSTALSLVVLPAAYVLWGERRVDEPS